MDLPAEVRNIVYRLVLCEKKYICLKIYKLKVSRRTYKVVRDTFTRQVLKRQSVNDLPCLLDVINGKWVNQIPSALAILRVSKAIHNEAGPVVYGSNVFSIPTAEVLREFLSNIGRRQRKWVRSIEIQPCGRQNGLRSFCEVQYLTSMKLTSVIFGSHKLQAWPYAYWNDPSKVEESVMRAAVKKFLNTTTDFLVAQSQLSKNKDGIHRVSTLFKLKGARCEACTMKYHLAMYGTVICKCKTHPMTAEQRQVEAKLEKAMVTAVREAIYQT